MQNDFNKIELNKNLQTDLNEFNKNGIFFTERKAIQKVELLGNECRVRETEKKPKLGKNDGIQVVATASIDEENRVAYGVNQSSSQRSRKYNPYDPVSYRDEKQALKNEKLYQGKGRYEKKLMERLGKELIQSQIL